MQKQRIRAICMTAMLTALSIVLARMILPTGVGEIVRFNLGNIPIVLCSFVFGPFYAGICGALSDIVGCFFNGYAPYPPLTLSPILVGVLPVLLSRILEKISGKNYKSLAILSICMVVTNSVTALFWTTLCLSHMQNVSFFLLLSSRFPVNALRTVVEIVLIHIIFKSRILERTGLVSK